MTETLTFAIDRLVRDRQDPQAWQRELDERALWATAEQWDDE